MEYNRPHKSILASYTDSERYDFFEHYISELSWQIEAMKAGEIPTKNKASQKRGVARMKRQLKYTRKVANEFGINL